MLPVVSTTKTTSTTGRRTHGAGAALADSGTRPASATATNRTDRQRVMGTSSVIRPTQAGCRSARSLPRRAVAINRASFPLHLPALYPREHAVGVERRHVD